MNGVDVLILEDVIKNGGGHIEPMLDVSATILDNNLITTWLEQPHIILILSRDKFNQ